MNDLSALAVACQGLPDRNQFAAGEDAVAQAISHLGFLQIDTISVISRAHHHTLWNRVLDYETWMLDTAIKDRTVFEYWAHAAAYLPMQDYRYAQVRMRDMREGKSRWVRSTDSKLMRRVLKRIKDEGPLRSRDFESKSKTRRGWWDWKPTKHALEQLFMQGDLMITGRQGFQKRYDLRERVLPDYVDTRFPACHEYATYLIDNQLRSWGASPEPAFTYQLRGRSLRTAVTDVLADRLRDGTVETREVAGQRWYVDTAQLSAPRKPPNQGQNEPRACLLSPFDNLIIQRERIKNLFGFDYVLECYVPEGKRKYGYFVLPILYKNRFVGRMDCKAHRKTRVFEVKRLFWEGDIDPAELMVPVAEELLAFAHFNGARKVQMTSDSRKGQNSIANTALSDALADTLTHEPSHN